MIAANRVYHNKTELIHELIRRSDVVLDVGFWGQGMDPKQPKWVHNILKSCAKDVWGVDLEFDRTGLLPADHYAQASAEDFSLDAKFDVIFAGDLIEHLPNPGKFLDSARAHLSREGRLIITTPNAFNLFNLAEKLSKEEPTVNPDHTCYFNVKTLKQLFKKCGWTVDSVGYVYSLDLSHHESWKKRALNILYGLLSRFTHKYLETIVIVARVN